MTFIIVIDPGSSKCGLLLANLDSNSIKEGKVIHKSNVIEQVKDWIGLYSIEEILLGNGTSSKYWENECAPLAKINLIEEKGTTLRARYRYWEISPPSKWVRWLPKEILIPPKDLDAFAALVLLEDYLNKKFEWEI